HGSFGHIFFNMFAVWMFGAAIENVWGPRRFLTFYILTGLGAAVTHYAVVYFEMQPSLDVLNDYISNPDPAKLQGLLEGSALSKYLSNELLAHKAEFVSKYNDLIHINPQQAFAMSVDYIKELRTDVINAPVV